MRSIMIHLFVRALNMTRWAVVLLTFALDGINAWTVVCVGEICCCMYGTFKFKLSPLAPTRRSRCGHMPYDGGDDAPVPLMRCTIHLLLHTAGDNTINNSVFSHFPSTEAKYFLVQKGCSKLSNIC